MNATVERLEVEPIPMRNKPAFVAPAPEPKKNPVVETLNAFLPVFGALATILAVRLFLLFAVIGAFVLAQAALPDTTYHSMWVLVAYCSFTILPLVWLDLHGKKKSV